MNGDSPLSSPRGDGASAQAEPSFEKELANLERVVNLLERGDLDLEEAIREYERGYQSLKKCQEILGRAQKKIELLTRPEETWGGAPPSWGEFTAALSPPALQGKVPQGTISTAQHPPQGSQPL